MNVCPKFHCHSSNICCDISPWIKVVDRLTVRHTGQHCHSKSPAATMAEKKKMKKLALTAAAVVLHPFSKNLYFLTHYIQLWMKNYLVPKTKKEKRECVLGSYSLTSCEMGASLLCTRIKDSSQVHFTW